MISADVRATLAAIVLAHSQKRLVTAIYDYDVGAYRNIRANFKDDALDAYDSVRVAKVSGTLPDLFDHVMGSYYHLKQHADRYIGFDHYSGTHFQVVLTDKIAALYDYDSAEWSQYSA
ncbi:hypothetical protein [uncultured Brevundimonas sp.]|uniref:hypothetical protein n=1 Tax=uncultured Brevundimonas sp. TaxID=213418 RepID=UPI0026341F9D|nr:hypothetical protein [uncultured Brevundimonas sp.]